MPILSGDLHEEFEDPLLHPTADFEERPYTFEHCSEKVPGHRPRERKEKVGMGWLNTISLQDCHGKVRKFEGHYHIDMRLDRGSKHMAIFGVREAESLNPLLIPCHEAHWGDLIHQVTGALQLRRCHVGVVGENVAYPFSVDFIRQTRHKETGCGQPHQ